MNTRALNFRASSDLEHQFPSSKFKDFPSIVRVHTSKFLSEHVWAWSRPIFVHSVPRKNSFFTTFIEIEWNAHKVFIEHQNYALSKHEQQIYGFSEHWASRTSKFSSKHERVLSRLMWNVHLWLPILQIIQRNNWLLSYYHVNLRFTQHWCTNQLC